jgi:flagellin-like hook-associated protein FlgL
MAAQDEKGVNLQVSNNAGTPNIINLSSKLFESAKCTALFIENNDKAGSGDTWYERTDPDKEPTTSIAHRIAASDEYEGRVTALDPNNYEDKTLACITAICDAVYTDDATAREFLTFIDDAIENVSGRTSLIGAYMNRVESAVDAISVQKENIVSANSSIKDADVATESSNYIKYQILQQSSATLLATANQTPSIALNLL